MLVRNVMKKSRKIIFLLLAFVLLTGSASQVMAQELEFFDGDMRENANFTLDWEDYQSIIFYDDVYIGHSFEVGAENVISVGPDTRLVFAEGSSWTIDGLDVYFVGEDGNPVIIEAQEENGTWNGITWISDMDPTNDDEYHVAKFVCSYADIIGINSINEANGLNLSGTTRNPQNLEYSHFIDSCGIVVENTEISGNRDLNDPLNSSSGLILRNMHFMYESSLAFCDLSIQNFYNGVLTTGYLSKGILGSQISIGFTRPSTDNCTNGLNLLHDKYSPWMGSSRLSISELNLENGSYGVIFGNPDHSDVQTDYLNIATGEIINMDKCAISIQNMYSISDGTAISASVINLNIDESLNGIYVDDIYESDKRRLILDNCSINGLGAQSNTTSGIMLRDNYLVADLNKVTIRNFETGVYMDGLTNILRANITIDDPEDESYVTNISLCEVGIYADEESAWITGLRLNVCENSSHGLWFAPKAEEGFIDAKFSFTHCTFNNNGGCGIKINDETADFENVDYSCDDFTIGAGCEINDNGEYGIYLAGCDNEDLTRVTRDELIIAAGAFHDFYEDHQNTYNGKHDIDFPDLPESIEGYDIIEINRNFKDGVYVEGADHGVRLGPNLQICENRDNGYHVKATSKTIYDEVLQEELTEDYNDEFGSSWASRRFNYNIFSYIRSASISDNTKNGILIEHTNISNTEPEFLIQREDKHYCKVSYSNITGNGKTVWLNNSPVIEPYTTFAGIKIEGYSTYFDAYDASVDDNRPDVMALTPVIVHGIDFSETDSERDAMFDNDGAYINFEIGTISGNANVGLITGKYVVSYLNVFGNSINNNEEGGLYHIANITTSPLTNPDSIRSNYLGWNGTLSTSGGTAAYGPRRSNIIIDTGGDHNSRSIQISQNSILDGPNGIMWEDGRGVVNNNIIRTEGTNVFLEHNDYLDFYNNTLDGSLTSRYGMYLTGSGQNIIRRNIIGRGSHPGSKSIYNSNTAGVSTEYNVFDTYWYSGVTQPTIEDMLTNLIPNVNDQIANARMFRLNAGYRKPDVSNDVNPEFAHEDLAKFNFNLMWDSPAINVDPSETDLLRRWYADGDVYWQSCNSPANAGHLGGPDYQNDDGEAFINPDEFGNYQRSILPVPTSLTEMPQGENVYPPNEELSESYLVAENYYCFNDQFIHGNNEDHFSVDKYTNVLVNPNKFTRINQNNCFVEIRLNRGLVASGETGGDAVFDGDDISLDTDEPRNVLWKGLRFNSLTDGNSTYTFISNISARRSQKAVEIVDDPQNARRVVVEECNFSNNDNGVFATGSNMELYIHRNNIRNRGDGTAVSLTGTEGIESQLYTRISGYQFMSAMGISYAHRGVVARNCHLVISGSNEDEQFYIQEIDAVGIEATNCSVNISYMDLKTCEGTAPCGILLRNCTGSIAGSEISSVIQQRAGAGIRMEDCQDEFFIRDCEIHNYGFAEAAQSSIFGGIYLDDASPRIVDCNIYDNQPCGVAIFNGSNPIICRAEDTHSPGTRIHDNGNGQWLKNDPVPHHIYMHDDVQIFIAGRGDMVSGPVMHHCASYYAEDPENTVLVADINDPTISHTVRFDRNWWKFFEEGQWTYSVDYEDGHENRFVVEYENLEDLVHSGDPGNIHGTTLVGLILNNERLTDEERIEQFDRIVDREFRSDIGFHAARESAYLTGRSGHGSTDASEKIIHFMETFNGSYLADRLAVTYCEVPLMDHDFAECIARYNDLASGDISKEMSILIDMRILRLNALAEPVGENVDVIEGQLEKLREALASEDGETFSDVNEIPETFDLSQAWPNPFNPSTSVKLSLPENGQVSVIVYDLMGREVIRLLETNMSAGFHTVQWNGTSTNGTPVASGMYLIRASSTQGEIVRKTLLMK